MISSEGSDSGRLALCICEENLRELFCAESTWDEELLWLTEHARARVSLCASSRAHTPELPDILTSDETHISADRAFALSTLYARLFLDAWREHALSFGELFLLLDMPRRADFERFVYLRTPTTDRLYTHFSSLFSHATVYYASSFEEACSEIYNERADYTILPLFGTGGELIRKFLLLIEKYELCILNALSVTMTAEGEGHVFVLVGRGFNTDGIESKKKRTLSFLFSPSSEQEERQMYAAAAALNCRVRFAERSVAAYDRCLCRLFLEGEGLEEFLVWLMLIKSNFSVTGFFETESSADV